MRLTAHFHADEFESHDGAAVPAELLPNLRKLAELLEQIRDAWAGPLAVISGYRSESWNRRVGGAPRSAHMTAEAADIRPTYLGDIPLKDRCARLHSLILSEQKAGRLPTLGGLGIYKGWVHVDVRKAADGHLRRWAGGGVGSESE